MSISGEPAPQCASIQLSLTLLNDSKDNLSMIVDLDTVSSESIPWVKYQFPIADIRGEVECTFRIACRETEDRDAKIIAFVGSPVFIPDQRPLHPHIIMVCFDALRADELGAYGSAAALSPVVDRISRSGVTFSQTVSSSSWTIPAMKNLLSGQYTFLDQAELDEMIPESGYSGRMIQSILADAGYYTAAVVSNPVIKARRDFDHGFDAFDVFPVQAWKDGSDNLILDRLREILVQKPSRPMFIYIHVMDPHDPYNPSHPYRLMHGPVNDTGIRPPIRRNETGILNLKPFSTDLLPLTDIETDYLRQLYRAEIRQADALLLKISEELNRLPGDSKDSVLIVTSDHGEEFGEHGYYQHGMSLHETSIEVPWIMMNPIRLPESRIIPERVSTIDIPATICRLIGVNPEPTWDGISVFSTGTDYLQRRLFFTAVRSIDELSIPRRRWRSIYQGDRKLVWSGTGQVTAYDLSAHPEEIPLFQKTDFIELQNDEDAGSWQKLGEELERFTGQVVEKSGHPVTQLLTEQLKELGYVR